VAFDYDGRPAVRDVSLALAGGQVCGLLGPNGSGKSTVLRLAAGLLAPRHGTVRLDGQPLAAMGRAEIARRVAVVPQSAPMPDAFTGWEVAFAGRTPHLGPFRGSSAADDAIVCRALALVDAGPLADRRVSAMSGGERQRLLLARALAQEPDVLLLDEPTTHLDLAHQVAFLDLVLRLAEQAGLAIAIVFHDLSLASEYCDSLLLMHKGTIVARGTPAEVLTPALISSAYGLDVSVVRHPQSGRPVVLLPPAPRNETDPDLASESGRESSEAFTAAAALAGRSAP
jgi:iron complex transport system ATP-binding protein